MSDTTARQTIHSVMAEEGYDSGMMVDIFTEFIEAENLTGKFRAYLAECEDATAGDDRPEALPTAPHDYPEGTRTMNAMIDTTILATRAVDGEDVEHVTITVSKMRSCTFLHLRGADGKSHMFEIATEDWHKIVAEQSADKYAHES